MNHPYGAAEHDAMEKLQFEFWYLRHQSIALDLRIIARMVALSWEVRLNSCTQVAHTSLSLPC